MAFRKKHGLSRTQLAGELGLTVPTIDQLEAEQREPIVELLTILEERPVKKARK